MALVCDALSSRRRRLPLSPRDLSLSLFSQTNFGTMPKKKLTAVTIENRRNGDTKEARQRPPGQVVQACQRERLPRQSRFQTYPTEQEVWLFGKEQSPPGPLRSAWSKCLALFLMRIALANRLDSHGPRSPPRLCL